MSKTIIAFDLYGTILSTESISQELSTQYGDDNDLSRQIATNWRRYQLEYTFRLNSMGIYRSFEAVTTAALHHALAEVNLKATEDQETSLMQAYNRLSVFSDAHAGLALIEKNTEGLDTCIFSNGTLKMISESVAPFSSDSSLFRKIVTVEDVQVFKPDKRTYEHLLKQYEKENKPGDVWLVSSNPFDVVGAIAAGLKAAWVDRTQKGWVDNLGNTIGDNIKPTMIAKGVDEAVQLIVPYNSS
ncbi:HAD-like domain-containing protein [Podospora fimiseda]|uniref:HAD-like domain-containing protein n=1 Tax=Podospora fimiseda TaxID=252190 RepID=A0AAN7BYK8_9PEZI|nr:HAD-like domain-containing protein [Podospora fimiseda]